MRMVYQGAEEPTHLVLELQAKVEVQTRDQIRGGSHHPAGAVTGEHHG